MKKFISLMVIISILALAIGSVNAAGKEISVKVNGNMISFPDAKPFINGDNRTLVPVRFVSEALGAKVDWKGGNEQLVTIEKDSTRIVLKIGEKWATVNGSTGDRRLEFDTKAVLKGDRAFVPLRFVSEGLGTRVNWDSFTSTALVTSTDTDYPLPIDTNSGLTAEQILRLKQYPDKVDSYEVHSFGTSKVEIWNDYMPFEEYLKKYGIEEAKMAVEVAKGHIDAIHNVDYRKGFDEYKATEVKFINPQDYESKMSLNTKYFSDNKLVVSGRFYSDPSLVYIPSDGGLRVKGIVRYFVSSCSDIEKVYCKGVKLNQWIEEDIEVELYSLTVGKWEYYFKKTHTLSQSPRYVEGVNIQ